MKTLFLTALFVAQSLFAIVSITPVEIGENVGIHTKLGASLETQRGSTDKDNYKGFAKVIYDSNTTYIAFVELSAEYGETNQQEDTNKAYIHLRYIHALTSKSLRAEFFLQAEEDKFKEIKYRRLTGLGLRYRLCKLIENGNGYIGTGLLYENVNYLEEDANEKNIVINNYIAYAIKFSRETTFEYRLDFQPVYKELEDYVLIQKLGLNVKLYEGLSLKINMTHDVDSNPAEGVDKNNFSQATGLVYSF